MKTFADFLLAETLGTPVPWHWVTSDDDFFQAKFTIGSATYEVQFLEEDPESELNVWSLTFARVTIKQPVGTTRLPYPSWQTGITKTGQAFTIFATILAIMKDFVSTHHPNEIYFTADEPSRQKLYSRLGRMARSLDPTYSYDSSGEPGQFRVYRTGHAIRSRFD